MRRSVGKDASSAGAARHRQEQVLASKAAGIQVVEPTGNGTPLVTAVVLYLDETKTSKKPKTYEAYKTALNYFTECCTKATLEEIQRADLLKFAAFLRDKKNLSPRTFGISSPMWRPSSKGKTFVGCSGKTTGRGTQRRNRRCTNRMN